MVKALLHCAIFSATCLAMVENVAFGKLPRFGVEALLHCAIIFSATCLAILAGMKNNGIARQVAEKSAQCNRALNVVFVLLFRQHLSFRNVILMFPDLSAHPKPLTTLHVQYVQGFNAVLYGTLEFELSKVQ